MGPNMKNRGTWKTSSHSGGNRLRCKGGGKGVAEISRPGGAERQKGHHLRVRFQGGETCLGREKKEEGGQSCAGVGGRGGHVKNGEGSLKDFYGGKVEAGENGEKRVGGKKAVRLGSSGR